MRKKTVKIDASNLLGYRLLNSKQDKNVIGAKVGEIPKKPAATLGAKVGSVKGSMILGAKVGAVMK